MYGNKTATTLYKPIPAVFASTRPHTGFQFCLLKSIADRVLSSFIHLLYVSMEDPPRYSVIVVGAGISGKCIRVLSICESVFDDYLVFDFVCMQVLRRRKIWRIMESKTC